MKYFLNKLIAVATIASISPLTFASTSNADQKYLGFEVIQTDQSLKGNYGYKNFKKNPLYYGIFGGVKFSRYLGLELGYDYQPKRNKTSNLSTGDLMGNGAAIAGTMQTQTFIKSRHPYIGLVVSDMYKSFNLQAMLGVSLSKITAQFKQLSEDGIPLTNIEIADSVRNYSKTRLVPILKVAAAYKLNDHFAIRASLNYRFFNSFTIRSDENASNVIKVKNTAGVGVGVMYYF